MDASLLFGEHMRMVLSLRAQLDSAGSGGSRHHILPILVQVLRLGSFSGQAFISLRSPGVGLSGLGGDPGLALGHPWARFGRHGPPKADPGAARSGLGVSRAGSGVHFRIILGWILVVL